MLNLKEKKAPLKLHKEQTEMMVTPDSVEKIIYEIDDTIARLELMRDWLLGNW